MNRVLWHHYLYQHNAQTSLFSLLMSLAAVKASRGRRRASFITLEMFQSVKLVNIFSQIFLTPHNKSLNVREDRLLARIQQVQALVIEERGVPRIKQRKVRIRW